MQVSGSFAGRIEVIANMTKYQAEDTTHDEVSGCLYMDLQLAILRFSVQEKVPVTERLFEALTRARKTKRAPHFRRDC